MLPLSVFAGVGHNQMNYVVLQFVLNVLFVINYLRIETLGTYNKDVLDIANRLRALLFVLLLFEKINRIITLAYFLIAAI